MSIRSTITKKESEREREKKKKVPEKTSHWTNQQAHLHLPCNQPKLPTSFSAICLHAITNSFFFQVWKPIIFIISPFWFPSVAKKKSTTISNISLFSIQLNAIVLCLGTIHTLLDLVVYMRNDRPCYYTNLSFSCVQTWIEWHANRTNVWIRKQYARKWWCIDDGFAFRINT